MADLAERGDVDRVVQLAVAVRVEPVTNSSVPMTLRSVRSRCSGRSARRSGTGERRRCSRSGSTRRSDRHRTRRSPTCPTAFTASLMRPWSSTSARSMRRTSSRNSTAIRLRSIPIAIVRSELAELGCGPFRREILRQSAFDHLAQHRVQPTDRPGPSRGELVMPTCQQPQHLPVILERDRPQIPVPQRDDRRGTRVVRVGLVLAARSPTTAPAPTTRRAHRRRSRPHATSCCANNAP